MTIESLIRTLIKDKGYITIDEMMRQILTCHHNSYYRHKESLGVEGDFITAPEISQLFGEIIGVWCIEQRYKLNCPAKINIVELGAGRGLLMRDLLRVVKLVPEFFNNLTIQLVEINPYFIEWQKKHLSQFNLNIEWLATIDDIAPLPTIIIANEFFDALPIKQYTKINDHWYEIVLIIDQHDNQLKFDKIPVSKKLHTELAQDYAQLHNAAIVEKSDQSSAIIRFIADHFKKYSGASLIIDYGYDIDINDHHAKVQYQSTLQAVKNHQYHNIFDNLGTADLSAHVDFNALKTIAHTYELQTTMTTQSEFLLNYGILTRATKLRASLVQNEQHIINSQLDRLISPANMGNLFKVLCITAV